MPNELLADICREHTETAPLDATTYTEHAAGCRRSGGSLTQRDFGDGSASLPSPGPASRHGAFTDTTREP
jgi:hypothetical protein